MKSILCYIVAFVAFALLISCGSSKEEINAAAQLLFDDNLEELKITAEESCAEKRTVYVKMYKDSITKANAKNEVPAADE